MVFTISIAIHKCFQQIISSINLKAKWNKIPSAHILYIFCHLRIGWKREKNPTRFMMNKDRFNAYNHKRYNKRINLKKKRMDQTGKNVQRYANIVWCITTNFKKVFFVALFARYIRRHMTYTFDPIPMIFPTIFFPVTLLKI